MIKFIGAFVIIMSATLFGFEFSNRLSRRTKQIRYMKLAFEALETEIVFAMTPLAEACKRVSQQTPAPVSQLFETVAKRLSNEENSATAIWDSTLKGWRGATDLEAGELNILVQFGQTLGKQDLENQRKQIRLAISYFDQEEKEAQESQKKYESMYRSLGLLAGILIVLIMF